MIRYRCRLVRGLGSRIQCAMLLLQWERGGYRGLRADGALPCSQALESSAEAEAGRELAINIHPSHGSKSEVISTNINSHPSQFTYEIGMAFFSGQNSVQRLFPSR
jgi:hypothetical protein